MAMCWTVHPDNREHTVISGTLGSHKLITCNTQKSISKFCKVEMIHFDHSVIKLETNSTIKKPMPLRVKVKKGMEETTHGWKEE